MVKQKVSLTLSSKSRHLLAQAEKLSRHSKSKIVDELIQQKLGDPKKLIKEELREKAKQINALQEKLSALEDLDTEEDKKVRSDLIKSGVI